MKIFKMRRIATKTHEKTQLLYIFLRIMMDAEGRKIVFFTAILLPLSWPFGRWKYPFGNSRTWFSYFRIICMHLYYTNVKQINIFSCISVNMSKVVQICSLHHKSKTSVFLNLSVYHVSSATIPEKPKKKSPLPQIAFLSQIIFLLLKIRTFEIAKKKIFFRTYVEIIRWSLSPSIARYP